MDRATDVDIVYRSLYQLVPAMGSAHLALPLFAASGIKRNLPQDTESKFS